MICSHMLRINNINAEGLALGNYMDELYVRPNCKFSRNALDQLREGKEAYIDEVLTGFNTIGVHSDGFNLGFTQEQRDFIDYQNWSRDLGQCLFDRKRGYRG